MVLAGDPVAGAHGVCLLEYTIGEVVFVLPTSYVRPACVMAGCGDALVLGTGQEGAMSQARLPSSHLVEAAYVVQASFWNLYKADPAMVAAFEAVGASVDASTTDHRQVLFLNLDELALLDGETFRALNIEGLAVRMCEH